MNAVQFESWLTHQGYALTVEQQKVVAHVMGPLVVFAGPGSGKTTTILLRALHLLNVEGVSPTHLTIVTFTRKSAEELKQRLKALHPCLADVRTGTYHSLFLHWYMQYSNHSPRIMSAAEQHQLKRRSPTAEVYNAHKLKLQVWDYDDILTEFYHLLLSQPSVVSALSQLTPYFMIDEFQDTNPVQLSTVNLLCKQSKHIVIVGDDDQAIYRFRGATPHCMLTFREWFPDSKEVVLTHNFRSTDAIIQASKTLIEKNVQRREKAFIGVRGDGMAPCITAFSDEKKESAAVAQWLCRRRKQQPDDWTVAILARTHAQLYPVMAAMHLKKVRYQLQESSTDYLEHPFARATLTMIRANVYPKEVCSEHNWRTLVTIFSVRDLEKSARPESTERSLRSRLAALLALEGGRGRAAVLQQCLDKVSLVSPSTACQLLYEQCKTQRKGHHDELAWVYSALQMSAERFSSTSEWLTELQHQDMNAERYHPAFLTLSTLHGAKGLEFDDVIIIGLHADACPHPQSLAVLEADERSEAVEEERRLLYVGMTRARNRLDLTYPQQAHHLPRLPSVFLSELTNHSTRSKDRVNVSRSSVVPAIGETCLHKEWGEGTIVSVEQLLPTIHKVGILCAGRPSRYVYWQSALASGIVQTIDLQPKIR